MKEVMKDPYISYPAVAVLVLLAVFLGAKTVSEVIAFDEVDAESRDTITVQGNGEVFASPDMAEFSFAVVEERDTVAAAQQAATQKTNDAIDALKQGGVAESDIQTRGYNISPQYDYVREQCAEGFCPPGNRELRGFEVRQTIAVKVRDLENIGSLLSDIGNLGVSQVSSLTFSIEDDETVQSEARGKAIDDAKEKARELADSLGIRLGDIVAFNESGDGPIPYRQETAQVSADGAAGGATPQIPAGENQINSNVSITYEIK